MSRRNTEKLVSIFLDFFFLNLSLIGAFLFFHFVYPGLYKVTLTFGLDIPVDLNIVFQRTSGYFTNFYFTIAIRFMVLVLLAVYDYDIELDIYSLLEQLFKGIFLGSIAAFGGVALLTYYYGGMIFGYSKFMGVYELFFNILLLSGWRLIYIVVKRKIRLLPSSKKNTVIMGINEGGRYIISEIGKFSYFYDWAVIGFVRLENSAPGDVYKDLEVDDLGAFKDILHVIETHNIKNIIIVEANNFPMLYDLTLQCQPLNVRVFISTPLFPMIAGKIKSRQMPWVPLNELILQPISITNSFLKRSMDIFLSLIGLILTAPLFPIIALAIKLTSKGPIIFRQIRVGKDGRPFNLYKFRTMIDRAESMTGPVWTPENDPRITSIGRFLRKISLDELPQLLNVFTGKMSLVGPRPERPHFVGKYKGLNGLRLSIKPGLTGLAQIYGRADLDIEEKILHDLFYVNNYSIFRDIHIILKTIHIILTRKGAR